MSDLYHVTLSQGRADSLYLEATTKSRLLNFLGKISTAVTRNVKKVVYSKAFNINYVNKEVYKMKNVYYKVVIVALTKDYSQSYTLFNVKNTVTKEIIEDAYKGLLINDQPIIDFFDIQFYNAPDNVLNPDNLFQLQYKRDSKTYIENIYAPTWKKAKEVFDLWN